MLVRFAYLTDGGVALRGWEVTDVAIGGEILPSSAFAAGWIRVDGRRRQKTDRYYIAEYRTYDGFDEGLKNCYQLNCDYASWVDWFRYNRGLHLIYRDTFYDDNDVATHVGHGGWMVVDAHPRPTASPTATARPTSWATGGRASRCATRRSASSRPGRRASTSPTTTGAWASPRAPLPARRRSRSSTTRGRTGTPDAPEAGVKIPKNLGVRISVKSMGSDVHDDPGRQREVTRRLAAT